MQIHLTMLSIDRAELKVTEGEFGGAAALLASTVVLVKQWGVTRETLAVLRMLHEAVAARQCQGRAFRQASLAVRRSWSKAVAEGEAS